MTDIPPLVPFCAAPFTINKFSGSIDGVDAFGGPCMLLQIRGWGYLTGHGQALRLPEATARKAQTETAQWVCDAMNAKWEADKK